ncbi:MAG: hypothetical protein ACAI38_24275 [Myxococcota bacterium]
MAYTPSQEELDIIGKIPERTLEDVLESIRDGAKNPAEAFGFSEGALIGMENVALAYYKAQKYPYAAVIFGFVLQMNTNRASAWRGLGACAHALKDYIRAGYCYRIAMDIDPDDVPSKVFLGECLCQAGATEEGVALLQEAIERGTPRMDYRPYIARARAIVSAGGGRPASIVLMQEGQRIAHEATEALNQEALVNIPSEDWVGATGGVVPMDEQRDITWEDMKKNPKLRDAIQELSKAVAEGRLTYAQVGGFTKDEMDGAYAIACRYCDMGEVLKCIQITGYLIFLDPQSGRYYQLVGICLQRLKQYEAADFYYKMALILDPTDPMSLVYRGECKILSGNVDAGLAIVREGLEIAKKDPEAAQVSERAQVLIKQFGA